MRNITKFGALTIAAALAAGPVLAQTNAPATVPGPAVGSTAIPAVVAPATRDATTRPVGATMTDASEMRASKVIGAAVYNDHNEKVGTVDDLVIGRDNKPLTAILSVGGFLGAGNKLVAVPFSGLKSSDNRWTMPGATKDSLKAMGDYHFSANHRDATVHRG